MDKDKTYKLKVFIYYLLVEPWTESITMPNPRTLIWVGIFVSILFKIKWLTFIGLIAGLISYLFYEYKNGRYIYWYRNRKFSDQRKALKKVREDKKKEKENIQ